MPKLPEPPSVDALRRIPPELVTLTRGTRLARVFFAGGDHPTRWDEFRHYGPTGSRFDHHVPDDRGESAVQERSILYCATAAPTCFAEVFQATRRINRTRRSPRLVVFVLQRDLTLLDLTGTFPTRAEASMAINTGSRSRARRWAQCFHAAYDTIEGIYYPSSMCGNRPAVALNERAERSACLPELPEFNRALADDLLVDVLKHCGHDLGYGLI